MIKEVILISLWETTTANTHVLPCFLVLHYWWQLLVISDQDKSFGVEQRPQTDRLADLWRFIHDAEIESASGKNGVLDAHTGGRNYQLVGKKIRVDHVLICMAQWTCVKSKIWQQKGEFDFPEFWWYTDKKTTVYSPDQQPQIKLFQLLHTSLL